MRKKVFELTEFITDILKVDHIDGNFPHKVGMHVSTPRTTRIKAFADDRAKCPFLL